MATHIEVRERVNKIFNLIVQGGFEFCQVRTLAEEEGWGVTDRQLYNYIDKADDKFEELANIHREKEFGRAISNLNLLFKEAFKESDYRTCLAVIKERNKLLGMYE